jgi:hypothetical protein
MDFRNSATLQGRECISPINVAGISLMMPVAGTFGLRNGVLLIDIPMVYASQLLAFRL